VWCVGMNLSRRSLIGAGLLVAGAGLVGCSKAVQAVLTTASAPTADPLSASGAATGSAAATAGVSASPPVPSTTPSSDRPLTALSSPPGPPPSGSAVEIAHGPRDKPGVALTFHGAGDVGLARHILQIADARGARITVMVVGTWLSDNPGFAAEIVAGGHQLGNHTWSHQDINSMSEAEMRQEVIRCRDLLIQTVGTAGAYFRPSQTPTANPLMKRVAGAAGYAISLSYDVDSMDYTDPGAGPVRTNVAAAQAGSIVSMHLGHQDTIDALPGVLDDLNARGLAAVTVGELLAG
jgi:peptidoglycan/xylan/chitin deacetylase (PgdA/CDA1 family)